jgi:hypothetical protein
VDHLVCCLRCLGCCANSISNGASFASAADGTMSRLELLPESLMNPWMVEEVIAWLLENVVRPLDRKEIFIEWLKEMGLPVKSDLIIRVYPPG